VQSELQALARALEIERVHMRYDLLADAWMFVVLDSVSRGPAVGGTRMRLYGSPRDGLMDALRLARAMTYKLAIVQIQRGGGKGVLALSRKLDQPSREALLRRYGRFVDELDGEFTTGIDLGTTAQDLLIVAEETEHVHTFFRDKRYRDDLGGYTAQGVMAAIRSAVRHVMSLEELTGLTALVQGVGAVGAPLSRMLAQAGARLKLSDIDLDKANRQAREIDAEVVESQHIYDQDMDLFVPCAEGGILNRETIARLRCRIVVGSANNQLSNEKIAHELHSRGITYIPDYLANAGAALAVDSADRGHSESALSVRIEAIGEILTDILNESSSRGEHPLAASRRRIERALIPNGEQKGS
jgi:leucine dehydrogenase